MPRYKISYPDAEPMVKAERREKLFKPPNIAEQVMDNIMESLWLEDNQQKVDIILALIEQMGNAKPWQMAMAESIKRQIHRTHEAHRNHRVEFNPMDRTSVIRIFRPEYFRKNQ